MRAVGALPVILKTLLAKNVVILIIYKGYIPCDLIFMIFFFNSFKKAKIFGLRKVDLEEGFRLVN